MGERLEVRFDCKVSDITEMGIYDDGFEEVEITKVVELTKPEYNYFTCNFLEGYRWLEGTAGETIKVVDKETGNATIVKTEGYNYARYVSYEY